LALKLKIYERHLAREIYAATGLVLLAFLMLFAFFDLIHQLESIGKGGYQIQHALGYVILTLPGRLYELFPIGVLIGTLYALTVLARHSEITVLRAAGLSTRDFLGALAKIGIVFLCTDPAGRRTGRPALGTCGTAAEAKSDGRACGAGVSFGVVGSGRTLVRQCARGTPRYNAAERSGLRIRRSVPATLDQSCRRRPLHQGWHLAA
jgi:hypothetical protein